IALAENGSDAAVQALVAELVHAERPRRLYAIRAVALSSDERLTEALVPLIDDSDQELSGGAVRVLVQREDATALATIDRLLSQPHRWSNRAVPQSFYALKPAQMPVYARHLDHPDHGAAILKVVVESGLLE